MSAQFLRPGQFAFAHGDGIFSGIDAEYASVGRNNITYAGHFWLDESGAEPLLMHEAHVCNVRAAVGRKMKRSVRMIEEEGVEVLVLVDRMVVEGDGEGW